ncbi:hypothetical protein SDC9_187555 [bioreactor metagenome]|uniref:Uncharacterized protein n=1 Tax=bioreactor metagenome TaxID=1076179 RepID=A0A645HMH4_9ZZZZ
MAFDSKAKSIVASYSKGPQSCGGNGNRAFGNNYEIIPILRHVGVAWKNGVRIELTRGGICLKINYIIVGDYWIRPICLPGGWAGHHSFGGIDVTNGSVHLIVLNRE